MTLKDQNGCPVILNSGFAAGGEADIYTVRGTSDLVAKIFKHHSRERFSKLTAMVKNVPLDPTAPQGHVSICWPQSLLFDSSRTCRGFLMHAIDRTRNALILQLYNPKARRRIAPAFTWASLVRISVNVASVVEAVHAYGYVIGDLNESNFFVSDRALISLIDCDSMQVPRPSGGFFRCTVGKEEFTAPELQGSNWHAVDRNITHDNFALAVLLFQLLMEGVHPFSGVWLGSAEPLFGERISKKACPYIGSSLVRPMPYAPNFDALPSTIQHLFSRCFDAGHSNPKMRPSAREWRQALSTLEQKLITCIANANHVYSDHTRRCVWCDRKASLGYDPFPAQKSRQPTSQTPPAQISLAPIFAVANAIIATANSNLPSTKPTGPTATIAPGPRVQIATLTGRRLAIFVAAVFTVVLTGLVLFFQLSGDKKPEDGAVVERPSVTNDSPAAAEKSKSASREREIGRVSGSESSKRLDTTDILANPSNLPTIDVFGVDDTDIVKGASTRLRWVVKNAITVDINPGFQGLSMTGSVLISPDSTTHYTLTAKGLTHESTRDLTVSVKTSSENAQQRSPQTIPLISPPTISAFDVVQGSTSQCDRSMLRWTISGATMAFIQPNLGNVNPESGYTIVRLAETTRFVLSATGSGGSVDRELIVNVTPGSRLSCDP